MRFIGLAGKFYAKQTEPVSVDTAFSVVRRCYRTGLCLFFANFPANPVISAMQHVAL